ncbi:MAG: magnesium transporter [Dehalococcoidia bacterium]|nr:magnesium transporter [Dehalococcoidia bacterium]
MTTVDTSLKHINVQTVQHGSITWLDIQRPGVAEMQYLKERYPFHQLSLDDCLSVIQIPKLDEFEDHLFLVLHFPRFDKERRLTIPSEVDVFVGATYVVTIHAGDLRPLVKLFHDCQASDAVRQEVMNRGSGYLLYHILDNLVDNSFPILSKIVENVNFVEQQVFETRGQKLIREMAVLRRDILSYLRLVRPQIEVMEEMEEKDFSFLKVQEDIYFGDLADHMRRIRSELETLREVVDGLYDTYGTLGMHRTNDIIRVLTVAATVMLPFLLITSLYGMNVALPWEKSPGAFAMIFLVNVIIGAGLLAFFTLRRWF